MGNNKFKKEKFDNYKIYVNQLEKEYLNAFEKIEVYINGSSKLNTLEKNNCFLQILDTFLSCQSEGKSVYDVAGTNLKKYCDSMIYGESIYIYRVSRICSIIIGALFYVSFMHFFTEIFHSIDLKNSSIIFRPMNFGIGEIVLILGYICIPKIIDVITKSYFENPVRCKKVKNYIYYGVWIFTIVIYTQMKETFNGYGIDLPFSSIVLILIYSAIVSIALYLLERKFNDEKLKDNEMEKKDKYCEFLKKEYERYSLKCKEHNKELLGWDKFIKKKVKSNFLFTIIFFIYGIIFLGFEILIGRNMLISGDISAVSIVFLIGIAFVDIVIIGVVREVIYRTKQLVK